MSPAVSRPVDGLSDLADSYDVLLCDVWGVIHNGIERFDVAVDALERFRRNGGTVALITNAPRPASSVSEQLQELGITTQAYDHVVTSGDVTRDLIASRGIRRIHHLGPDRDLPFFDGLDVTRVSVEDAEAVVCTGLMDDETETPADYRALFSGFERRGLAFYCANPDRVVRRGDTLYYCAGALADLYRETGGQVIFAGKPNPPIYERALREVEQRRGAMPARARVLVIGDGIETDMGGAAEQGLDALFITGGIHADDAAPQGRDAEGPGSSGTLQARLEAKAGVHVAGVLPVLAW